MAGFKAYDFVMEYKIVEAATSEELSAEVTNFLRDGWKLVGAPQCFAKRILEMDTFTLIQAITKSAPAEFDTFSADQIVAR
jgi:hypothetical protein